MKFFTTVFLAFSLLFASAFAEDLRVTFKYSSSDCSGTPIQATVGDSCSSAGQCSGTFGGGSTKIECLSDSERQNRLSSMVQVKTFDNQGCSGSAGSTTYYPKNTCFSSRQSSPEYEEYDCENNTYKTCSNSTCDTCPSEDFQNGQCSSSREINCDHNGGGGGGDSESSSENNRHSESESESDSDSDSDIESGSSSVTIGLGALTTLMAILFLVY